MLGERVLPLPCCTDSFKPSSLSSPSQVLNERAVAVMKRMGDKLTGRDFTGDGLPQSSESDSIASQVQRLISQATSHENLCQSYIGWCPFW